MKFIYHQDDWIGYAVLVFFIVIILTAFIVNGNIESREDRLDQHFGPKWKIINEGSR